MTNPPAPDDFDADAPDAPREPAYESASSKPPIPLPERPLPRFWMIIIFGLPAPLGLLMGWYLLFIEPGLYTRELQDRGNAIVEQLEVYLKANQRYPELLEDLGISEEELAPQRVDYRPSLNRRAYTLRVSDPRVTFEVQWDQATKSWLRIE